MCMRRFCRTVPTGGLFDRETAMELMIEDIKNFDVKVFLAFQRVIHEDSQKEIILPSVRI